MSELQIICYFDSVTGVSKCIMFGNIKGEFNH